MTSDKPRVLIVHHHEHERTYLKSVLETLDCIALTASSGEEALELAGRTSPNLILLNLHMPDAGGYETAQIIRKNRKNGSVPILFLTGSTTENNCAPLADMEAVDLLRKPYYPFELISRCRALLDLKKYEEELEVAEQVLQSFAIAVEARDPTTGNHCDRLFYRLSRMADHLQLEMEERKTLLKGAVLHDIGKVGVPDHILLKEGPLTDREWEVMRQHVVIGESLCRPLKFLHPVLPLIRHHHERYDGSGYPDGLKGDQIPLVARVFQVCDVFDALTNPRSYKPAFSKSESMLILEKEAEKGWWDPVISGIFLRMVAEEGPYA